MDSPDDPTNEDLDSWAEQVRDQTPEWQLAWECLVTALLPILERQITNAGPLAGGAAGVDEGISNIILFWQKGVTAGTLLRHWSRTELPVSQYLCSRSLRTWARSTASQMRKRMTDGEAGKIALDDIATEQEPETAPSSNASPEDLLQATGPIAFKPLGQQGVTQPHLVAGLNLRPDISWQEQPGPQVHQDMPDFLEAVDHDQA